MKAMHAEGTSPGEISGAFIPCDEVVFPVYESATAGAACQLNKRVGIPVGAGRGNRDHA